MKKITLLAFALFAFALQGNAQFTESFETEIPATWTILDLASASSWVWDDTPSGSGGAQDGDAVARIAFDGAAAHNDYLITPEITVNAGVNDRLSFYIQSRSSAFLESYEVLLSTGTTDASDFTVVLQAETDAPAAWTQLVFNLSAYVGQSVYIAVRATGFDEFELYVDNFINDAAPSCPEPTSVSVTTSSSTEATITWTAGGSETNWTYEFGLAGFTQGTGTIATSTTPSVNLTGLTIGETYDVYVQANCGGDDSIFTSVVTWTMPPANNIMSGAIPITPSPSGTGCASAGFTLNFSTDGTTDSGMDGTCNNTDTGLDQFFTWTATTDGLLWNDTTPGNPGIIIRDVSGNEISCAPTFAADDFVLSGWSIGDDLIIQIYDFGAAVSDVAFCLEEFMLPTAPECVELPISPSDSVTDVQIPLGELTLTWTAPSTGPAPTGYEFFFGTESGNLTSLATVTELSIDLINLLANTTYYWQVVPVNGPVSAANCAEFSFTTGSVAIPTTAGSLTINSGSCEVTQTANLTYDPVNSDSVLWVELVYDGNCNEVTIDTENSALADTEIGIYDSTGLLIGSNDDGGTDSLSSFNAGALAAGTYYIAVGGFNVIFRQSFNVTSDETEVNDITVNAIASAALSIEDRDLTTFKYYPNPVKNKLTLNAQKNIEAITMYNILGQEVLRTAPNTFDSEVDMSNLQNGTYFVKVTIERVTKTIQVIKE